MILNKKITINITNKNVSYYKKLGYNAKSNEKLTINVLDLTKGSKEIVEIQCDYCNKIFTGVYKRFVKEEKHSCGNKSCKLQKTKETNLKKYGVENVYQSKNIKDKIKQTNLKRYGVENPSQSKKIQEKIKYNNFKKYGVEHTLQIEKIREKGKQTLLKKYGVEHPMYSSEIKEKLKQTNLKKYNTEYANQSKIVKEKTKQTNFKKYGVECFSKTKEYKEKTKQTNLKKFNVEYPTQSKEIQEKTKQTNLKRYGVKNYSQSKQYKENNKIKWIQIQKNRFNDYDIISFNYDKRELTFKCDKCNNEYTVNWKFAYYRNKANQNICVYCNPINSYSNFHNEICYFLDKLNIKYVKNDRSIISPLELDIYIPEYDLAIETNGVYWHSELFKDKFYHQNKLNLAKDKNIRLIQIWEDDWYLKHDIIKRRLKIIFNKEKVLYARKCQIKELTNNEYKEFLNEYHLQGYIATKVKLGLYYNNELVSVIGFGNLRKNMNQQSKENEYELYRFAEKYHIVGGLSKLFKHFIKQYNPTKIITYQDLDWGYSNLYEKLGFKLEKITNPGYFYSKNGIRENRFKYRKDQLIKEGFDINKTEHEIMLERGYYKIYNSGNIKWNWTN